MQVLALDGGGAAGYVTAQFLSKLEKELGEPCCQTFDLIAGVSTGSIIGACLARGMPAYEIAQRYRTLIGSLFPEPSSGLKKYWKLARSFFREQYSLDSVQKELEGIFPKPYDTVFKTRFMCHTVRLTNDSSTVFWKSWNRSNTMDIVNAIVSSCSAPTFFRPHEFEANFYIDGAMSSNSTSMCALAEAIKLGADLSSLYMLNLQCGGTLSIPYKQARKLRGKLNWAPVVADFLLNGGSEIDEYQAHQMIGFRNHVVKPLKGPGLITRDFASMDQLANQMWAEHGPALIKTLTLPN